MSENTVSVGLGEFAVTRDREAVLAAYGVGASVVVAVYDPRSGVAGLLHAALPLDNAGGGPKYGKYVDSGLAVLLNEMLRAGARKEHLIVRMAGGSNMLTAAGFSNTPDIGRRNTAAVELVTAREGLAIAAADVGGHVGRTVSLHVGSGRMMVQVLGQEPKVLGAGSPALEGAPHRTGPITRPLLPIKLAGG